MCKVINFISHILGILYNEEWKNKVVMLYNQLAFQIKRYLDVIFIKNNTKNTFRETYFQRKYIKYLEIVLF